MGALEANVLEDEHVAIGEDRPVQINVKQSDGTTAQTMTGWTLQWTLMDRQGGTALITKTPTIQNGSGTDDQAAFDIDAADWTTASIANPGALFHALSRTDSGSVQMLAFGKFVVHAALATA